MLIATPYFLQKRSNGMLRVIALRLVPIVAVSPIRFEGVK